MGNLEARGEPLHRGRFGARACAQAVVDGYRNDARRSTVPGMPAREQIEQRGEVWAAGDGDKERGLLHEIGEQPVRLGIADGLYIVPMLSSGHASVPAPPLASR